MWSAYGQRFFSYRLPVRFWCSVAQRAAGPKAGQGTGSPTLRRVDVVISQPAGSADVRYRMVARPLVERLEAVRGRVELVVLRPPTLEALDGMLTAGLREGRPSPNAGGLRRCGHFSRRDATAGTGDRRPDGELCHPCPSHHVATGSHSGRHEPFGTRIGSAQNSGVTDISTCDPSRVNSPNGVMRVTRFGRWISCSGPNDAMSSSGNPPRLPPDAAEQLDPLRRASCRGRAHPRVDAGLVAMAQVRYHRSSRCGSTAPRHDTASGQKPGTPPQCAPSRWAAWPPAPRPRDRRHPTGEPTGPSARRPVRSGGFRPPSPAARDRPPAPARSDCPVSGESRWGECNRAAT